MIQRILGSVALSAAVGMVVVGVLGGATGCQRTPAAEAVPVAEPLNPKMQRNWVADLGLKADKVESVHAREDGVYVYTDTNKVILLNKAGGKQRWASQVGEAHTSIQRPIELGNRVVLPVNTKFFVYDKTSGIPKEPVNLNFAIQAPGVGQGDVVYVGAAHPGGARVAAVDITRKVGPVTWEFMTQGAMSAAPALYDNVIFVGGEDNRVYAVSTTRRPVWGLSGFAFETDGRIVADLAADEYAVYVASTDTKLYALDRMSGKIKWAYYAERSLTAAPFVTADSVYEFVAGKGLVALDKTTGSFHRTPRWTAPDAVQVVSVGARRVYVKMNDGRIGALDRQTGELVWHGTWTYTKFAVNTVDPTIYAATDDGKVYSYMPAGETAAPKSTAKPVVLTTRPATGAAPATDATQAPATTKP